MHYEKHYKLLCSSRQLLKRMKLAKEHLDYCYYELHHIVPVHENGSNEASNLVLLTAREHFIAHWLFAKWKQTPKAWFALMKMLQNKTGQRILTSKQYEIARKACSLLAKYRKPRQSKSSWNKGIACAEDCKLKISASSKGHKKSEQTKAKYSAYHKGKPKAELHIIRRSYSRMLNNSLRRGFCNLQSKEHFLALEAYIQYAKY